MTQQCNPVLILKFMCLLSNRQIRQENLLLYSIYQSVGVVLYYLSFPFVLLLNWLQGNVPYGLGQRYGFGLQSLAQRGDDSCRIWIHAASVGEVLAARVLIRELKSREKKCEYFLSTMTKQGLSVASRQLPPEVFCFLAPLDITFAVRRFLVAVEPDAYVCLETELWPVMFTELHRMGIPSVILNGRMTKRSSRRYTMIRDLIKRIFGNLAGIAVISEDDGKRFRDLGASPESILVTGNIKYDYPFEDIGKVRQGHRSILKADKEIVFISGSTRTGEEEILFRVFKALEEHCDKNILWVIAPRHLERLGEVKKLLSGLGVEYDLYSHLKYTERTCSVVLVDTMGELGQLYSAGDFNFVGGSLVEKRGHNIIEAAQWGRPVYYGPSIDDFNDAAEILEGAGASFRVADGDELAAIFIDHLQNNQVYERACVNAAHAVSLQRGAAGRQVDMLLNLLPDPVQNK